MRVANWGADITNRTGLLRARDVSLRVRTRPDRQSRNEFKIRKWVGLPTASALPTSVAQTSARLRFRSEFYGLRSASDCFEHLM